MSINYPKYLYKRYIPQEYDRTIFFVICLTMAMHPTSLALIFLVVSIYCSGHVRAQLENATEPGPEQTTTLTTEETQTDPTTTIDGTETEPQQTPGETNKPTEITTLERICQGNIC